MNDIIKSIVPDEKVIHKIYELRGQRVMLDRDLAELYQVETRVLNQAVKRNKKRFPSDFMFRLAKEEFNNLKSQIVISNWNGVRKMPYAFTEQGVAMLAGVINSDLAIKAHIQIIRVFFKLREMALTNRTILLKLEKIEKQVTGHVEKIAALFKCLKNLIKPNVQARDTIGFRRQQDELR
jgi:hypothetical protein